jgi:carbonic anhydrase/acetyltransferase-like protein (isoleucine patch superfamily)
MPTQRYQQHTPKVHALAYVHPSAQLIGEIEIAEEASVWPTCVLRGDNGAIRIGPRTSFQDGSIAHATLGMSSTTIGAQCTIGHRVVLHGCQVGDNCLIGIGSTLLDGVEIGDGSFVAAGTLLTPGKKFPPRSFIMGTPGKLIREVTAKETEWISHSWNVYLELCRQYRG